jgi:hypothetical protein
MQTVAFLATFVVMAFGFFFTRWATAVPNPHISGEMIHALRPRWTEWAFVLMVTSFAWGVGALAGFLAARLPHQPF